MSASLPTSTLERFEAFEAHHGPIESPIEHRILGYFMERAIGRFFDYPRDKNETLGAFVLQDFKRYTPDLLACLELAADWTSDPLTAARRHLREELDTKAKEETEARQRQEQAALQAKVRAKAEEFVAGLNTSRA